METGRNASKNRNWAFVIYPNESAPENWIDMLRKMHVKSFISPLHDKDVDSKGEIKKAHHHILLMFEGPVAQKRANEIIEPFNGTKSAEYIYSKKSYIRYLAHLDNPEKFQYDSTEILALNGADVSEAMKPTTKEYYQIIGEIMCFCEENGIAELSALTKYAREERNDWFPVIIEKAYLMTQFLASLRHSKNVY